MNCPVCKKRMNCIDSRQIDAETRFRIYECYKSGCGRWISTEELDLKVINEEEHEGVRFTNGNV